MTLLPNIARGLTKPNSFFPGAWPSNEGEKERGGDFKYIYGARGSNRERERERQQIPTRRNAASAAAAAAAAAASLCATFAPLQPHPSHGAAATQTPYRKGPSPGRQVAQIQGGASHFLNVVWKAARYSHEWFCRAL